MSLEHLKFWISKKGQHPFPADKPTSLDLFQTIKAIVNNEEIHSNVHQEDLHKLLGNPKHLIFLMIDGWGMNLHQRFSFHEIFDQSLKRELVASYPSTTSVALSSLACAEPAGNLNVTGWWTYYRIINHSVSIIRGRERLTNMNLNMIQIPLEHLIPTKPFLNTEKRMVLGHYHHSLVPSHFSNWTMANQPIRPYKNIKNTIGRMNNFIKHSGGKTYQYLYYHQVDNKLHRSGIDGPDLNKEARNLANFLLRLKKKLKVKARIIVSSDHGQVNIHQHHRYVMRDHHPLMRYLIAPPTGEARNPVFHVVPGREEEFRKAFEESDIGRSYWLMKPKELEKLGFFGKEGIAANSRSVWGTYIGVSHYPAYLEYLSPGNKSKEYISAHGGLTKDEMLVPLYVL